MEFARCSWVLVVDSLLHRPSKGKKEQSRVASRSDPCLGRLFFSGMSVPRLGGMSSHLDVVYVRDRRNPLLATVDDLVSEALREWMREVRTTLHEGLATLVHSCATFIPASLGLFVHRGTSKAVNEEGV